MTFNFALTAHLKQHASNFFEEHEHNCEIYVSVKLNVYEVYYVPRAKFRQILKVRSFVTFRDLGFSIRFFTSHSSISLIRSTITLRMTPLLQASAVFQKDVLTQMWNFCRPTWLLLRDSWCPSISPRIKTIHIQQTLKHNIVVKRLWG